VDLLDPACKNSDLLEMLYLISREALSGAEIDRYWRQKEATNRFVVTQVLLSPPVLGSSGVSSAGWPLAFGSTRTISPPYSSLRC
jgi:hypothetical protein